jgi:hypothetical protein
MRRAVFWILSLALGTLISSGASAKDRYVTLALEQQNILRVGDLAELRIPSDHRYSYSGVGGAWNNVLVLVRHSRRSVLYRAAKPGPGVIIITPDVPNGQCISCATLHCFITVSSRINN